MKVKTGILRRKKYLAACFERIHSFYAEGIFSNDFFYRLVSQRGPKMKWLRILALLLALLCGLPSSVYAQGADIEWDILNQEVMDIYRAGMYDRAVVVAQKAQQVAEQNVGPDHPDVATSLNNLAEAKDLIAVSNT